MYQRCESVGFDFRVPRSSNQATPGSKKATVQQANWDDLEGLEAKLGVRFRKRQLLRLALTHKSVANESEIPVEHNERLEFLGDAVLGMIVADELYRKFGDASEGALTVMRSDLVRRSSLADWARRFELGEHLVLGRGEARAGGHKREAVLAAGFEAVIGALYLDRGEAAVRALIRPLMGAMEDLLPSPQASDPKSELQRRVQAASGMLPVYRLLSTEGPEHQPVFRVQVEALGGLVAEGAGGTKQAAEQEAAARALANWPEPESGMEGSPIGLTSGNSRG